MVALLWLPFVFHPKEKRYKYIFQRDNPLWLPFFVFNPNEKLCAWLDKAKALYSVSRLGAVQKQ